MSGPVWDRPRVTRPLPCCMPSGIQPSSSMEAMRVRTGETGVRRSDRRFAWSNPAVRSILYQAVAAGAVAAVVWFLIDNTLRNLASRHIATGFGFLSQPAGFEIAEALVAYSPADSYGRAIMVGLLNTLRVAVIGIVLATVLGAVLGICRLSPNWVLRKIAAAYVEVVRNTPLLLQLLLWYAIVSENLPGPREALHPVPGVMLSNRGLNVPSLSGDSVMWMLVGGVVAAVATACYVLWARRQRELTGRIRPLLPVAAAMLVLVPLVAWLASGAQFTVELPRLEGFGIEGGAALSPELFALLMGLVVYTAAFIAEIVRAGIQAIKKGQWEAAGSLGLSRTRALQLVIMPQALRIIIPPLTSQYLNLVKNSSLAVAVGYRDLVSVVNTTLNQTGQAIEGVLIIMGVYLTVSLSIALAMNFYNQRIALTER